MDETGLWVIYGVSSGAHPTNNTAVAKLNPYSLEIEYVWNISLNNQVSDDVTQTESAYQKEAYGFLRWRKLLH